MDGWMDGRMDGWMDGWLTSDHMVYQKLVTLMLQSLGEHPDENKIQIKD